ncbi:hypothetical protein PIB30_025766 [Stylosanthes scabra]|uniref:Uncharacterized protein n=1 Tax=Stylosanthes scabra TaxID=79078 RepID=A0ABU6RB11_9FABA|nr:hypothetical protein [Stylosanthes scabra]
MAAPLSVFRQYTRDDSFLRVFIPTTIVREYQIALTYARDYDENGAATNGHFRPTWDQTKVTPEAISKFKKKNPHVTVKVFISIGNKDTRFPFKPTSDSDVFVKYISEVITSLKKDDVITVASISPSHNLNNDYYVPLYKAYPSIDWVDYQFQNEEDTLPDPTKLVNKYKELAELYTKEKLISGYSAENEDWDTVSPIVFFLGAMDILKQGGVGFSIVYNNYHKPNSTRNQ